MEAAQNFINRLAALALDAGGVETGKDGWQLVLELGTQDGGCLGHQPDPFLADFVERNVFPFLMAIRSSRSSTSARSLRAFRASSLTTALVDPFSPFTLTNSRQSATDHIPLDSGFGAPFLRCQALNVRRETPRRSANSTLVLA